MINTCRTCNRKTEIGIWVEGRFYCDACKAEFFTFCECHCGWVKNDAISDSIRDSTICYRCRDNNYRECHGCGDWITMSNCREIDEHYYCNDCVRLDFDLCGECGDFFLREYLIRTYNSSNLCERCYEANYFTCDQCGDVHHLENYNGDGQCIYCADCDEYGDGLHGCDYKPYPVYHKMKWEKDNDRLFFGIELETECPDDSRRDFVRECPEWAYCKEDGSLDYGIEFVSHPASWDWLKTNKAEWGRILSMRDAGLRSWNTDSCGMHVHMSKNQFTSLHLYKFLKFFYENPDFIYRMSGRKHRANMNRWAALPAIGVKERAKQIAIRKTSEKYEAVNLRPRNTVEIRIFKGTLNPQRFWANIQFCHAVFAYTRQEGMHDISVERFWKFVSKNRKEYKDMFTLYMEREIVTYIEEDVCV